MDFKFIHAADLHLDSPLRALDNTFWHSDIVDEIRTATRNALNNLIELAERESVDFILITGDLYDGAHGNEQTIRHFRRMMHRLNDMNIPVYIVQGNHDADEHIKGAKKKFWSLPENVHRFSVKKPESMTIDELGVVIHGQGYARATTTEQLHVNFPSAKPGMVNIGLLHTNCGAYSAHGNYAPSTVDELAAKNYDYWALGHIHKRDTLMSGSPWIAYPGNTQGRSVRETGPKGCLLVTVSDGDILEPVFHPLDVMRWTIREIDIQNMDTIDAIADAALSDVKKAVSEADGRFLAARVIVTGSSPVATRILKAPEQVRHDIREYIEGIISEDECRVESVKLAGIRAPSGLEPIADDPIFHLLAEEIAGDTLQTDMIQDEIDAIQKIVRDKLGGINDDRLETPLIDLIDPDQLKTVLDDARQLILARLSM